MALKLSVEPSEESRCLQQKWFELLGDRDWNLFCSSDYENLKEMISFVLFGSTDNTEDSGKTSAREKYLKQFMKTINDYAFHGTIFINVIYVVCEDLKISKISIHPLFQIRRYIEGKNNIDADEMKSCVDNYTVCTTSLSLLEFEQMESILLDNCKQQDSELLLEKKYDLEDKFNEGEYYCAFIDENMRCYQSFEDYLNNNTLPKCKMIVPRNGKYRGAIVNIDEQIVNVLLEVYKSPACKIKKVIHNAVNTVSTIAGIGATGTFAIASSAAVTAAAVPFIPVILTGSIIVGGCAAAWRIGDNIVKIVDRKKHDESLSVANAESRNLYFGIAASALDIAAGAAIKIIPQLVKNAAVLEKVNCVAETSLKLTNAVMSGCIAINNVCEFFGKEYFLKDAATWRSSFVMLENVLIPLTTADKMIQEFNNDTYFKIYIETKKRRVFEKALKEYESNSIENVRRNYVIMGVQNIDYFNEVIEFSSDIVLCDDKSSKLIVDEIKQEVINASPEVFISNHSQVLSENDTDSKHLLSKIQSIKNSLKIILTPATIDLILKLLENFSYLIQEKIFVLLEAILQQLTPCLNIFERFFPACPPLVIIILKLLTAVLQNNASEIIKLLPANLQRNVDIQNILNFIFIRIDIQGKKIKIISNLVKYFKRKIVTLLKHLKITLNQNLQLTGKMCLQ